MNKNENISIEIKNYGCNAEGVGTLNNEVVFVPYSLVGETIDATIIKASKSFAIAKIININNQSKNRIVAPCPYFSKCGGCQLQHCKYEESLKIKTEIVQTAIKNIGKISHKVNDIIPSNLTYNYRNKISMPINPKTKKLGMYRLSSHNIIDIYNCLLQKSLIQNLIKVFNTYLQSTKNSIYDDNKKKGLLKSLVAREVENKLLVTVVINGDKLDDVEDLVELLKENFDNFGLNLNINKQKNNVILGDKFVDIYGDNKVEIVENGITYYISNQSFLQVNGYIKNKIYSAIFNEIKGDTVIDAYSGAGLLSAMMTKHSKMVYGIEIVEPATKLADELKEKNMIQNLKNINGDCSIVLPKLLDELTEEEKNNLTIVIDPPRKGCDKKVVESIKSVKPQKIIYVSCDPSTLARDLNLLLNDNEYTIKTIQPYDMFPQTKHIETLAILQKKSA